MESFEQLLLRQERMVTIRGHEANIIEVDLDTPLGCVELHHGTGIGVHWLLISMMGDIKVAVPLFGEEAPVCIPLGGDPIAYGKWYPFSVFDEDDRIAEGEAPGMLSKSAESWAFNCVGPDGLLTSVPVPREWQDQHSW